MLRSMSSAISGMQAFQTDLDVVGNNIANVNTVGFKSSRTDFSDVLSQTMSGGNGASGTMGGTNPQQVGLGTKVADIEMDTSQGPDQTTNSPADLAINGGGMFVVSPGSGHEYYTRAGNFTVDNNYNLVLPNGYVVQGFEGTTPPSAGALSSVNLKSWLSASTGQKLAAQPDVQIGSDGSVSVAAQDGNRYTIGTIALASFPNVAGLQKQGDSMFSQSSASGLASYAYPNDPSLNTGGIMSGALEMSNVDLAHEFSEMIVAQNGFTANSHMIGTDNQILQALVNMKNS